MYALQTDGVENACCEFDVATLSPTYRLLIGVPGRSNAFAISRRLGLPEEIIEEARGMVSSENTRFEDVVSELEATRQQLENEVTAAETARGEADRLRARFGINLHLEYYDAATLQRIIERSASILGVPIDGKAAAEIAGRSRGTPRIANALLRRVRDFAQVKGNGNIDLPIAQFALSALNIDAHGLDEIDNKILHTIIDKFKGGPVGVTTIATAIGEDAGTLEEVYEPFLIKEGFIRRTPRGREVTELAYTHLGLSPYTGRAYDPKQPTLF